MDAPLAPYRCVDFVVRVFKAANDAPAQPGGSCWHCGTAIMNCVVIQSVETGERHEVGTTCAERVGLDVDDLRSFLAEKYREQRDAERHARSAEARKAREEAERIETELNGEHGTLGRYLSGCFCDRCREEAPHGSAHRFYEGCRCLPCIDWAVTTKPERWTIFETDTVLVDLQTGLVVPDARTVDTRYGLSWRSDSLDLWVAWHPARRSTLVKKDVTEAETAVLCERIGSGSRSWLRRDTVLGCPTVDRFGSEVRV